VRSRSQDPRRNASARVRSAAASTAEHGAAAAGCRLQHPLTAPTRADSAAASNHSSQPTGRARQARPSHPERHRRREFKAFRTRSADSPLSPGRWRRARRKRQALTVVRRFSARAPLAGIAAPLVPVRRKRPGARRASKQATIAQTPRARTRATRDVRPGDLHGPEPTRGGAHDRMA